MSLHFNTVKPILLSKLFRKPEDASLILARASQYLVVPGAVRSLLDLLKVEILCLTFKLVHGQPCRRCWWGLIRRGCKTFEYSRLSVGSGEDQLESCGSQIAFDLCKPGAELKAVSP